MSSFESQILKKVKKDYSQIAKDFDRTRQRSWSEFNLILKYLKSSDQIIDLGCGNGRLVKFLKEKLWKNKVKLPYLGIDNNKEFIKIAEKNFPFADFQEGDFLDLKLPSSSSDAIISIAAFHHLPGLKNRRKALQEVKKTLKKDGLFIFTVWNLYQKKYFKYIIKSYLKWILTLGKWEKRGTLIPWGKTGVNRYYYAFKLNELKKLLTENNFKILEIKTGNNFTFICQKQ